MSKKEFVISLTVFLLLVSALFFGGMCVGSNIATENHSKIVHVDLDVTEETVTDETWKYPFLNQQISDYICKLSEELKLDSDLVVAILMVENPEFNPKATHLNENGTIDTGLFQLNDRYCYSTFCNSYWDLTVEFNPFNWKHNTFIALHHIEYLQSKLKLQDEVIMAYNCGAGAVLSGNIPDSTKIYLSHVKNNLTLLKSL